MEIAIGWRLTAISGLQGKVLPMTEFIQASLGANPSYGWRSNMAGQSVVRRGVRWQVGNGGIIRIWTDKWIPNPSTFKVISPPFILPMDARVSELIEPNSGTWRTDLIRRIFLPHEVDRICSIALGPSLLKDKLVWAPTTNGKFSACSAYKIAMELASEGTVGAASDESK